MRHCQPQRARLNHGLRDAQNVCALTKVGTVLNQSALRHEQREDVIPSFGVDCSEKFWSDLPVNRCEGDRD